METVEQVCHIGGRRSAMRQVTMPLARYQALSELLPRLNRLLREEKYLKEVDSKGERRDKVYMGTGIATATLGSVAAWLSGNPSIIAALIPFGVLGLPIGMHEIDYEWSRRKTGKLVGRRRERENAIEEMLNKLSQPYHGNAYTLNYRELRRLERAAKQTFNLARQIGNDRLKEAILNVHPDVTNKGLIRRIAEKISPIGREQEGRTRA